MAGLTATFIDADSFTVTGDLTATFIPGRRVKADCGVDGIKYGTVVSSAYTSVTTVNLTAASDDLTANLTEAWFGIVGAGNSAQSIPEHSHDGAEGTGGVLGADGSISFYYNNLLAVKTLSSGFDIFDTNGTDAYCWFHSSGEVALGRIYCGTDYSAFTVGSSLDDAIRMYVGGRVELYYNDIIEAETVSGGLKATNGLQIASSAIMVDIKDEDDMTSDSATALVTQQSVKAFGERNVWFGHNFLDNAGFSIGGIATVAVNQFDVGIGKYPTYFPRWYYENAGTMEHVTKPSNFLPTGTDEIPDDAGALTFDLGTNTAQGSLAAGDFTVFGQRIEAGNVYPLVQNDFVISFWMRPTNFTGTLCLALRNQNKDMYFIREFDVVASAWSFHELTFPKLPHTTPAASSWGLIGLSGFTLDQSTVGLDMTICIATGTTYGGGTADAWTSGNKIASSNQDNGVSSSGYGFRFSRPKLEIGSAATIWTKQNHADQIYKANREIESIDPDLSGFIFATGHTISTTQAVFNLPYERKRALPVMLDDFPVNSVEPLAERFHVKVASATSVECTAMTFRYTLTSVEITATYTATGAAWDVAQLLSDDVEGRLVIDASL